MSASDGSTAEYTGKDVSYYLVRIESPKRLDPYDAECEDIIEALGMTFAEGCAFKAIWRKCAARTLGIAKAGYKGGLYDAEKAEYYGARMAAAELRAATIGQQNMIDPADVEISEKSAKCKGCFAGCRDCCPGLAKIADEKLARMRAASAERFVNECVGFISEPASAIDDDSERMQAIGQNGNGGEHYGAPDWSKAPDNAVAYLDWTGSAARFASAFYSDGGDRFYRLDDGIPTRQYVLKLDDGRMDIDYPYFMRPAK